MIATLTSPYKMTGPYKVTGLYSLVPEKAIGIMLCSYAVFLCRILMPDPYAGSLTRADWFLTF